MESNNFIYPKNVPFDPTLERPDGWGFKDSIFFMHPTGEAELSGSRYSISGKKLPGLFAFIEDRVGLKKGSKLPKTSFPPKIPDPVRNEPFIREITAHLGKNQINFDPLVRLRHGHGQSQAEMTLIRSSGFLRMPDVVLFPENEDQVVKIVENAKTYSACLVPYGGGTNVTESLLCPTEEKRMIVSLDMRRMNHVTWIDPVNQIAHIEAGATGRDIANCLATHQFTMGHEPDSIEFSTLGGWIATRASGMKRNKYGNIEDLVLDVKVITAFGKIEHRNVVPRESIGIDPREWIFGSEGNFGIIVSATIKVFPLPEVKEYASILFPSFSRGYEFLKDLQRSGRVPASVRLVDNEQFQFGLAIKPKEDGLKGAIEKQVSKLQKFLITKIKGFDLKEVAVCTISYEGSRSQVREEKRVISKLIKKFGGLPAGSKTGKRGYDLTFSIAYIRDFTFDVIGTVGETFETSASWSRALEIYEGVTAGVKKKHSDMKLPGKAWISCRVTQLYDSGVCLYFTYGFPATDLGDRISDTNERCAEIEKVARDIILSLGGSISHHHGVGKIRKRFLPQIMSQTEITYINRVKLALDPENIFGIANQAVEPKYLAKSQETNAFLTK